MFKELLDKIPAYVLRHAKTGVITASLVVGLPLLCNYTAHHDFRRETGDTLYLRKMDGLFAHAQVDLSYSRNDIILTVFDPFGSGSRKYSDAERDGILDEVKMDLPLFDVSGVSGPFNLREHAATHPEIFKQENQRYQLHLKEFAERFPQDFKRMGLEKALRP